MNCYLTIDVEIIPNHPNKIKYATQLFTITFLRKLGSKSSQNSTDYFTCKNINLAEQ